MLTICAMVLEAVAWARTGNVAPWRRRAIEPLPRFCLPTRRGYDPADA